MTFVLTRTRLVLSLVSGPSPFNLFSFLGEATSPSDHSKCAIGFRFWEGSGYFRSDFFSGFPVFPLFIFCWSDFTGF
jgi:hypothetical protein